jgi:hypothetical protein
MATTPVVGSIQFTTPTSGSVTDIVQALGESAESMINEGNRFVQGMVDSKAYSYDVGDLPTLGYGFLNNTDALDAGAAAKPSRADLVDFAALEYALDQLATVAVPVAPTLDAVTGQAPTFDLTAPTITLPATPDASLGSAPGDGPAILDPLIPDAPLLVFPTVPTFESLAIPAAPSVVLPSFDGEKPDYNLVAPSIGLEYNDAGYQAQLADPAVAKLLNDLVNGGYGIDDADEVKLWNRARDRENQAARHEQSEIMREHTAMSQSMPQGALLARLDRARQTLIEKMSSVSREIALKRADMYVENRKFTLQEARAWEGFLFGAYNAIAQRAFEVERARVELSIGIYDSQVKAYNAQLEGYKAEAQVFETKMRAALNAVELYKSQIMASNQILEMNKAQVDLYQAQLAGIQSVVSVYKTRMEAANLYSEIQRTKLEVFRSQVESYSARVRAKQAEFGMYESAVKGQLASLDVYKSQIDAFNARLQSVNQASDITIKANDVKVEQYKTKILQYQSQLEALLKDVAGRQEQIKAGTDTYRADVQAYSAFVGALAESARTKVSQQSENNKWNIAALSSNVEKVRFRLEKFKDEIKHVDSINQWGAEFFRGAISSAINGISGLSVQTTTA